MVHIECAAALSCEVVHEMTNDIYQLADYAAHNEPKLLPDQQRSYNTINDSATMHRGGMFFLNTPGGTGKIFVTTLLLAKVRQQSMVSIAVASSSIAATLLPGGRTAHSTFKLPLNLAKNKTSTCIILNNSALAKVFTMWTLIIWDECTISHKAVFEAMEWTLHDITGKNQEMGEITFICWKTFI